MKGTVALALALIHGGAAAAADDCEVAGEVATCSGILGPEALPVVFDFAVDGVSTVELDATLDASAEDTNGVELYDSRASDAANLQLRLHAGGRLSRDGVGRDALLLRQSGSGGAACTVDGEVVSSERGVRVWADASERFADTSILVGEAGRVSSGETSLWIRNQGRGASRVRVAGAVTSGVDGVGYRGVHVSQNHPEGEGEVLVWIEATGTCRSAVQGVYVGHAGIGSTTVRVEGSVVGGADATELVPAGIVLEGEASDAEVAIAESGSVSALSDRAIVDSDALHERRPQAVEVRSQGVLRGFLELGGGDDRLVGNLDVRDFRDEDGDGLRETENIAVVDFGRGDDSFVLGAGETIRLLTVPDRSGLTAEGDDDRAPTFFGTAGGRALEDLDRVADVTAPGVEEAHVVGLGAFEHAGVITLQDGETGGEGPVVGDVLVLTGAAEGGVSGRGRYTPAGGELHLDVRLDDGAVDATDVLVLDDVATSLSPVVLRVGNAGGDGAFTGGGPGDGILVVRVRGDADEGAFVLPQPRIRVGAFAYALVYEPGLGFLLRATRDDPILEWETPLASHDALEVTPAGRALNIPDGTVLEVVLSGVERQWTCGAPVSAGSWVCDTALTDLEAGRAYHGTVSFTGDERTWSVGHVFDIGPCVSRERGATCDDRRPDSLQLGVCDAPGPEGGCVPCVVDEDAETDPGCDEGTPICDVSGEVPVCIAAAADTDTDLDSDTDLHPDGTCGCDGAGGSVGWWGLGAVGLLVLGRRRRA